MSQLLSWQSLALISLQANMRALFWIACGQVKTTCHLAFELAGPALLLAAH
jgi:hypothetical protein